MDGEDLRSLLADLHAKQKEVRARAMEALAARGPSALPVLEEALRDPDWVVRYRAVEALGKMRDPQVRALLLEALEDPRDHVRYMAAKGLGLGRVDEAVPALVRHLWDENEFVRKQSVVSLGQIGGAPYRVLREALDGETSPRVRDELIRVLNRCP